MENDHRILLKFANYVIGPAFLVVGLLVTLYLLESEALPLAKEVSADGMTPEFGLVAIKIFAPMIVAYLGVLLIRVKRVTRRTNDD